MSRPSSPFPSCFFPSATTDDPQAPPPPPPPPISGNPNLTTCLYHTDAALFSLTWSRSFLGRSLHLTLLHHAFNSPPPLSTPSFHLDIKPFVFWKKHGSKKLSPTVRVFWDLSRAKFGSVTEPQSGFFVAVVVDGELTLLVGDLAKEAHAKTKSEPSGRNGYPDQALVLKREHVIAKRIFTTRARFGGKTREIQINCGQDDCSKLVFSVDGEKVLQIRRLKWKFRGNERVDVDGVNVQISWDVYNWLFDHHNDDSHAVFMFRFEEEEGGEEDQDENSGNKSGNGMALWAQQQIWSLGLSGIEWRKMGKSLSSSSVSMSSAGSSGGSSSVMEWANVEDSELTAGPSGFSLMVYAWRR